MYAERILSPDPNVRQRTDEPFSRLDYAIYLDSEDAAHLLGASRARPADRGSASERRPLTSVTSELVLVTDPDDPPERLAARQLVVDGGGHRRRVLGQCRRPDPAACSKRRTEAVRLAGENARLYDEQRHIAETLQLSLLPQVLEPPTRRRGRRPVLAGRCRQPDRRRLLRRVPGRRRPLGRRDRRRVRQGDRGGRDHRPRAPHGAAPRAHFDVAVRGARRRAPGTQRSPSVDVLHGVLLLRHRARGRRAAHRPLARRASVAAAAPADGTVVEIGRAGHAARDRRADADRRRRSRSPPATRSCCTPTA